MEVLLKVVVHLQILLMEITNQFLTGERTQAFMIIVDEAWMLLDFAASFFAAFGRTVRKYGGSLVICVQNFMDLQKTIEHKTILENSTWTVMLKQDEKGLGAFRRHLPIQYRRKRLQRRNYQATYSAQCAYGLIRLFHVWRPGAV